MGVVASQSSIHRRRGEESHVWAAVVAAGATGRAGRLGAGDSVFEGYAVAWRVSPVSGWFDFRFPVLCTIC